ncbi:unnamed protein product [Diatraea saccharalis]|uniref:Cationic amino acid transporter C-terminal domain-containing protein n=1 Tax=Diatraea saccharalis TaxID=40085 RepID=A0A9N9QZN2_9NEOP|nr:unnamed protein product [Diatraea saccharalis]
MASGRWRQFRKVVQRRRVFEQDQLETSNLKRCLTGWDLTALGLGSTLGVGVYVLVGSVALHLAGPSIVLSFLVAAVASLFAGLCYAEFGARVPRAGSAYIYTYVTVGELLAFLVGWNNILESAFGTASVARGLSMYVDTMTNKTMSDWFTAALPVGTNQLSPYFDLFAFLIVILLGVLLAFGVRESSMVNNALALVNTLVIIFIVFAGAFKANSDNWKIPADEVPEGFGSGGFFPYGVVGMLRGAAICFYGFVGFDSISASGEEVKEPRRTIPFAILTVLTIVFIAYCSVAIVVTMMVPYFLQDTAAAVATAFTFVGWDWARWVVTVGAIFGISASLFGAMFPLPRLLYAMSSDGLLFHWLSHVSASRQTPVIATVLPAVIIALLAGLLELEQLVMMMCIGTLFAYTIVAVCIIVLRYRSSEVAESASSSIKQIMGCSERTPSKTTFNIVIIMLIIYLCACVSSALVWRLARARAVPLAALNALAAILLLLMALQPTQREHLTFKTPFVPVIPCLSIYFNIHLMTFINVQTWIRVLIWILIGIPIYIICVCCYKRQKNTNLEQNIKSFSNATKNGKPAIQIIVESPTPPDTMNRSSDIGGENTDNREVGKTEINIEMKEKAVTNDIVPYETEEVVVQHAAVIENNEEKEAKIIDLLDKVLQDEEDSYSEIISWKDPKEDDYVSTKNEVGIHRKSLSELSDTESDASLGNNILSKYDVIAQVHREDLPIVTEERLDMGEGNVLVNNDEIEEQEIVTEIDNSETNSGTGESGYSDTIDKTALNDSIEDVPNIPPPPPMDENYFASPYFKKSYTVPKRPSKVKVEYQEEESKPRESIKSNSSLGEDNLVFGSDRQINFLSKLNDIFQNKMIADDGDELRKRSHSTGNVVENTPFSPREIPPMFSDLKREIISREATQNLRPINKDDKVNTEVKEEEDEEDQDISLSKEDLKSKLENIFAMGGPQLLKPRLMKSNPPTPEESYQTDNNSSTESIPKLPKLDKNDTLKRQKAKFSEVLSSFRLSLNKDDDV